MAKAAKGKGRKKKTKAPVDVKGLMDAAADLGQARDWPVYVDLVFDPTASDALIDAVNDAFAAAPGKGAYVEKAVLESSNLKPHLPADLCVIVGGVNRRLGKVAAAARRAGIPTVVVVEYGRTWFSEEAPKSEIAALAALAKEETVGIPEDDVVAVDFSDEFPLEELGRWIVRKAPAKRVSMAADFAFLRRPLSLEITNGAALQNAAVGVLIFIPGADMPVITFNQASLVLQIASVYGHELDFSRIKEVAAVVAGAFGFRAVARELSGVLPGFGWAVKASIAYTGTVAVGRAALDYFDEGGTLNGLSEALDTASSKVADFAEEAFAAVQSQMASSPEGEGARD